MPDSAAKLLPNVRRLFIPDPGFIILDVDLAGADAQVVAWEAEDEDLKTAFRAGLNVHKKNAEDLFGDEYLKAPEHMQERIYKQCKAGVHGTNYLGSARTLAITLGWTVSRAEAFQRRWFRLHPGIKRWHERVHRELEDTRRVHNRFGFHRIYFDRIDSILPEAIAWGPQSTVAITCFKGALQIEERLLWVQLLLQVHDSLVMQIPRRRLGDILQIRDALLNPIPYDDPLTIQWGLALSARSWGDVEKIPWETAATIDPLKLSSYIDELRRKREAERLAKLAKAAA